VARVLKVLKLALAAVIVIALLIIAFRVISDMRKAAEPTQAELITATMAFDTPDCRGETPIQVTLHNIGNEDILKTEWSFSAHQKGHSTELTSGYMDLLADHPNMTDRIIKPGEAVAECSADPLRQQEYKRNDIDYSVYVTMLTTSSKEYRGADSNGI
jgi:hypothetical protein